MNIQYISDDNGATTGVLIPIKEWIEIQKNLKEPIGEHLSISQKHIEIVNERMREYRSNP